MIEANKLDECRKLTLLGVTVNPLSIEDLNDCIAQAIDLEECRIIAHHNLHSIYFYHHDEKIKAFFAQSYVTHIDGMPLVYWARLLGYPITSRHRVAYIDWIYPLMARAEAERWRVFYLGGKPGVADRGAEHLRDRFPRLMISTLPGYFGKEDNEYVLKEISAFQPHILMVGMGVPRQEHWVLDNLKRIRSNAILTAGACFDYLAGVIPTPPRWMGRIGLEWLYRLWSEPKRLAKRYLLEPWFLVPLMVRDIARKLMD